MKRLTRAFALATLTLAVVPQLAAAHQGNPNFRSVVHGISPPVPGLSVQAIGTDAFMQFFNQTGKKVVIYGYDGEPYTRLWRKTVQQNQRSPALYLNADRFAAVQVPPIANAKAPPEWKTIDKSGQLIWHDHRMHWMSGGAAAGERQAQEDEDLQLQDLAPVGDKPDEIEGTLYWVGSAMASRSQRSSRSPSSLLALGGIAYVRRRRAGPAPGKLPSGPEGEAW